MEECRGLEGGEPVVLAFDWTKMPEREGEALSALLRARASGVSRWCDPQSGHVYVVATVDGRDAPVFRPYHRSYGVCILGVSADRLI